MGNNKSSASASQQGVSPPDRAAILTEDTTKLSRLAFLLTQNETFRSLNLTGEGLPCDKKSGPFIDMINSITSGTYEGQDPIGDIKMTLEQLASCQKTPPEHQSLLERIGDFFLNKDNGKAIRRFLLLAQILIECLSLWYVLKVNNLLSNNNDMKVFLNNAFSTGQIPDGSLLFPPEIMTRIQQWDGNMGSVVETFRVGDIDKAPVLLIFNNDALNKVLQEEQREVENTMSETEEASQNTMSETEEASQQGSANIQEEEVEKTSERATQKGLANMPVTFVPEKDLHTFIGNYLQSGNLNETPSIAEQEEEPSP